MKKFLAGLSFALMMVFVLIGCDAADDVIDNGDDYQDIEDESAVEGNEAVDVIQVVATFSVITDMVEHIGGDLVEVYTIVPIGDNPEDHEVLPADIMAVTNADISFYNGLELEAEYDWFVSMMESADQVRGVDFFAVSDGVEDLGIEILYFQTEGMEDYADPHIWLDLEGGIAYIQIITGILSDLTPENTDVFEANAAAYIEALQALHDEWVDRFMGLPDDVRIMVTSEGAFPYFANAYGLINEFIWEINAEDEGTPEQMMRIVSIINDANVNYLFTESSISSQYMEQVSEETGVPIFGELFSDSLSEIGGTGETYYEMMRHNLAMVYEALAGE